MLIQGKPKDKQLFQLLLFQSNHFPQENIVRGRLKLKSSHMTVMVSVSGIIQCFVKQKEIENYMENPQKLFRPLLFGIWRGQVNSCPEYSYEVVNLQSTFKLNHPSYPFQESLMNLKEIAKSFGLTLSYKDTEIQSSILVKDPVEHASLTLNVNSHTVTAKSLVDTWSFLLTFNIFLDEIDKLK